MIKSFIGFVVLVIGMGIGYFAPVKANPITTTLSYPEIEPIEFVTPGASLGTPGGGTCG